MTTATATTRRPQTTDAPLARHWRDGRPSPPSTFKARKLQATQDIRRELRKQDFQREETTLDDGRVRFTATLPGAGHAPTPQIQITIGKGGVAEIQFAWTAHRSRPLIPGTWEKDSQADTRLGTFRTREAASLALENHHAAEEERYEKEHDSDLTPAPADFPQAGTHVRYLRAFSDELEALEGAIGTVTSEYFFYPDDEEENAVVAQFDWTPYSGRLTLDLIQEGEEWERVA